MFCKHFSSVFFFVSHEEFVERKPVQTSVS